MHKKKRPLKIVIPKKLESWIKSASIHAFPVERPMYAIGKATEHRVDILCLYQPMDWWKYSKPNTVMFLNSWEREAKKKAKSMGLELVGTIHSHTYYSWDPCSTENLATPSGEDLKNFSHLAVMGVCVVIYDEIADQYKTRLELYPARRAEVVRS